MKTTTEAIAESAKKFAELQKEMITGMFGDSPFKITNPFENLSNPTDVYENTVKFHTACLEYHKSVLNMLEAMNALNPLKTNK